MLPSCLEEIRLPVGRQLPISRSRALVFYFSARSNYFGISNVNDNRVVGWMSSLTSP